MTDFLRAALILAALLTFFHGVRSQTKQLEYWQPIEPYRLEIDPSDRDVRALVSRWDQIGADLKTTTSLFAGTFEQWGYRGWFLRWSPSKGFVYVYHSEGLSIIDFSFGKTLSTSEEILFVPEREMKETFDSKKLRMPTRWIPIGSLVGFYLIPKERIQEFGNYAGGFGEFNDFNGPCCDFSPFLFMPNVTTRLTPKPSILVVPATYQRFIKEPIKARITLVGKKKFVENYGLEGKLYSQLFPKASLTPVMINVGRRQGVKQNQLLRLIGEPHSQYLKIIMVGNNRSRGIVIRDVDDDGKETYFDEVPGLKEPQKKSFPPIRVGIRVTSSPILDF